MDSVEILLAILNVLIALTVAYIAYMQYKIGKGKLRLDLYDKRFKVYYSIMELLNTVSNNEGLNRGKICQFSHKTNESRFLFEHDIPDYIKILITKALKLSDLKDRDSRESSIDAKNIFSVEIGDLEKWFDEQYMVTNEKFMDYLLFKKHF